MKNKKGFTLVELLAVIIVLAVVAVISIPVIGNLIDKAKKDMLRDSAINLVDSGKTYYANALMDNDEGLESSKKFTIGENINELDFKGRLPSSGYLEISTKGDISLAVVSGEYCAKKEFYDTEIIITDNLNECNVSGIDKAETVNDSCFVFNAKTRTITGYNFNKKECDKPNIAIPATIGDIPVEHIAPGAFVQDSDGALAMYYDPNGNEEEFMDIYENASYYKEAFGYEMALVFPVRNIKQNFGKYCVSNNPGITMDDVRYDNEYLNESSITKVMSVTSSRDKCYAMPKGEASEEEVVAFGTRLDSIDFSDATNLKAIGDYAFFATSLSSIKFGDNPVLDRIGNSAFLYNEIEELDLSGASSLYEIDNSAFINNYLTVVKFPNSLSIIGNQAFRNNFINSINVPTSLEYIGEYAFADNYIRRFDAKNSNLETIGNEAFRDNAIEYITLPEGLTYIAPYAFRNNYLGNLVIPSTLSRINNGTFYESGLTSLTLKEGVTTIDNYAFAYNYDLHTVSLPNGLNYIGYEAFYYDGITSLTIPGTVEEITESSFAYNNINTLVIEPGVKYIRYRSFYNNPNLTNLTLNEGIVEIDSYAFYDGNISNNLVLPSTVKYIYDYAFSRNNIPSIEFNDGILELGYSAFSNNSNLASINIPASLEYIGRSVFYGANLQKLNIPGYLTTIPEQAFSGAGITELVLNSGITEIERFAFTANSNLTKVTLPEGLTTIDENAFYSSSLQSVTIPRSVTYIGDEAFVSSKVWQSVIIVNTSPQEEMRFNDRWGDIGWPNSLKPQNPIDYTLVSGVNNFEYFGSYYKVNVPTAGSYKLEVWGAQGGSGEDGDFTGGKGGYSSGVVTLPAGTQLYVYVGGKGEDAGNGYKDNYGGFNGGGSSIDWDNWLTTNGAGGGATDIRIGQNSLYARVIVAGGGGGGGGSYFYAYSSSSHAKGGAGGGNEGRKPDYYYGSTIGNQGTQISGYEFGQGGDGEDGASTGAGGGGGWYGGHGSGHGNNVINSGGSGGSGWIYTVDSFSTWQTGNPTDAANWLLDNTYYLTEATTTTGNASFLDPDGSSVTGHANNGYARITKVG